jgi:hypothetical protein
MVATRRNLLLVNEREESTQNHSVTTVTKSAAYASYSYAKYLHNERPFHTVCFSGLQVTACSKVKFFYTQCKYATLYGYETVAR